LRGRRPRGHRLPRVARLHGPSELHRERPAPRPVGRRVSWSTPVRVPTRAPDAELPALAVAGSGRLALAYYALRGESLDVAFVSSGDGGVGWTRPQRLSSRSFALAWIVRTSQGLMVGDYISTSFA